MLDRTSISIPRLFAENSVNGEEFLAFISEILEILPVTQHDRMICEGYYRSSGRDRKRPTVTRSEKIVFSTEACVGCGICTGVCPHGSWKLVNGRSVAEGDCENCLACVHNCPMKAISIIPTPPEPEEANRNARFRNPNVSVADLIKSNSQI